MEVLGLRKLEDVIHDNTVWQSSLDWLALVPCSSNWVPPHLTGLNLTTFFSIKEAYQSVEEDEARPLVNLHQSNLLKTLILGNRDNLDDMPSSSSIVFLTTVLKLTDRYDLYGQVAYPKCHKQIDVPGIYRLAAKTKAKQQLVLICLGEIGRRKDLSSHVHIGNIVIESFQSFFEERKSTASYALSYIAIGSLPKYLPIILNRIDVQKTIYAATFFAICDSDTICSR